MDYTAARVKGDLGEDLVHRAIRAEMDLGYRPIDNLLLEIPGGATCQIDHVVIDRFGILVIETKCYDALLKGTSEDSHWTACYRGKKRHRLLNPLRQNEQHRRRLHRLLAAHGVSLEPDYVQSLVVFAEGTISHLSLSAVDQMRVTDVGGVRHFLQARHDFQPNAGGLRQEDVDGLARLLMDLDRSTDEAVRGRHDKMVAEASRRSNTGATKTPAAAHTASRPMSTRNYSRVYDASARSSRRPSAAFRSLVGVVAGLSAMMVALMLMTLAIPAFTRAFVPTSGISSVPGKAASSQLSAEANIPHARRQLLEAMPELEAALVDPDRPVVGQRDGLPSYTWNYLQKTSDESVVVREVTIVLDASGRIVGAD